MKKSPYLALFTVTLLAGCPTAAPRNRVEVAPGIYEDTLLSELSPEQSVEMCRAIGDSCNVATTPTEPLRCVSSEGGVCGRAPFDFDDPELVRFSCLRLLRLRLEINNRNGCTSATVRDWIQCDREQLEQCQNAPGRWDVPSCAPVACQ